MARIFDIYVILTAAIYISVTAENMKHCKIETFKTRAEKFSVGIISDTQLPPTKKGLEQSDTFKQNLKKALMPPAMTILFTRTK